MATMEIRNTVNGNKQKNKQTDLKDIDYLKENKVKKKTKIRKK